MPSTVTVADPATVTATPMTSSPIPAVAGVTPALDGTFRVDYDRKNLAYSVLSRILGDAVRDRMLAANPAHGVKLPQWPPRRNIYLTAEQLQRLADESGRYRSLVLLLSVGGLRWGEAAALRVCDVDFLRRRVELHRNAVQTGNGFAVGSLKSNKSRAVVLPAFVTDALAQTAEGKDREDLLWPSRTGGYLGPPSSADSWCVFRCAAASSPTRRSHG